MTQLKSKFAAACLAILMLATWFTVGCSMGFRAEKHTGPVVLQVITLDSAYQFLRSNGEMFVMSMTYEGRPRLGQGDKFDDIVYYDDGYHRVFVKAEGYKSSGKPEESNYAFWTCPNSSQCTVTGTSISSGSKK